MTTRVIEDGPGSVNIGDDPTLGWEAADVGMRYEDIAPEHGTDTIALIDLEGVVLAASGRGRGGAMNETRTDEPCPFCGREEKGTWFTPCPSDDCPSYDTPEQLPTSNGDSRKLSISIELTLGDAQMLRARLTKTIDKTTKNAWAREHYDTGGDHYGLTAVGTSAYAQCPVCIEQRQ